MQQNDLCLADLDCVKSVKLGPLCSSSKRFLPVILNAILHNLKLLYRMKLSNAICNNDYLSEVVFTHTL